ncbi:unnamed protein product, partial [marine sediment metagenome]
TLCCAIGRVEDYYVDGGLISGSAPDSDKTLNIPYLIFQKPVIIQKRPLTQPVPEEGKVPIVDFFFKVEPGGGCISGCADDEYCVGIDYIYWENNVEICTGFEIYGNCLPLCYYPPFNEIITGESLDCDAGVNIMYVGPGFDCWVGEIDEFLDGNPLSGCNQSGFDRRDGGGTGYTGTIVVENCDDMTPSECE